MTIYKKDWQLDRKNKSLEEDTKNDDDQWGDDKKKGVKYKVLKT